MAEPRLPVESIREAFLQTLAENSVILSAPTGSGKSTQVPRWCPGPVLVIEPRRVAARTLAARVAKLEGCAVGEAVGYHVRDDKQLSAKTRIAFVTPGIALLEFERLDRYRTIILDEFHERSLQLDLLFALLRKQRLVIMSATLDAERIANALQAKHLNAEGRAFEVSVRYAEPAATFPSSKQLAQRVAKAVQKMSEHEGDMLVFLPGKGEIAKAASAISLPGATIVPLHGELSPAEQARAFDSRGPRKIILSTNVAETSVTVPGVKIVIDAGLVRQTRYHQGRGALTLTPIAQDSAEQRKGRAGRVAPGHCLRLWGPSAQLKARTAPELYREALAPLVLAASACGHDARTLRFLDPPKEHALQTAVEELQTLRALDAQGKLTEEGKQLFRLPLDPGLGRLLIEARKRDCLEDAIDLVAMLAVSRSPFSSSDGPPDDDDPRAAGCDAQALVQALRSNPALKEAQGHRRRLRRALGLPSGPSRKRFDRHAIAQTAIAADRRSAYIARHRKRHVAWANGGTEIELDRRSALELVTKDGLTKLPEAMVVLGIRAMMDGPKTRIIATAATPISLALLDRMEMGALRLGQTQLKRGKVSATVERVYAGKVLSSEQRALSGALLRSAVQTLFLRGTYLPKAHTKLRDRLDSIALLVRLSQAQLLSCPPEVLEPLAKQELDPERFVEARLLELGLEDAADLSLLEEADLLPEPLPEYLQAQLDKEYPRQVELGEASYRVEYEPALRRATLYLTRGTRRTPPPRQYLPRFSGLRVQIQAGGTLHTI